MRKGFLIVTLAFMALSLLVASPAFTAKKFPDKPVKMVITHGAGGSVDISSRGIAPYLQKHLGVTVICENMEGAGGRRAMEFVFNQAKPDGYTFVASAFPSRLIGELIYDSDYRMKEFVHLGSWVGGSYRGIFVRADSPVKSFQDLVAETKKRKLSVASGGGMGSSGQVQIIYLKEKIKLNIEMVPFDSGAEVLTSVLGKHVDFGVGQFESLVNPSQAGQTRILAIHAPKAAEGFSGDSHAAGTRL